MFLPINQGFLRKLSETKTNLHILRQKNTALPKSKAVPYKGCEKSGLKLTSEEACGGLYELCLKLGCHLGGTASVRKRNDTTYNIALGQYRHRAADIMRCVFTDNRKEFFTTVSKNVK
jgi:hypothetical protein